MGVFSRKKSDNNKQKTQPALFSLPAFVRIIFSPFIFLQRFMRWVADLIYSTLYIIGETWLFGTFLILFGIRILGKSVYYIPMSVGYWVMWILRIPIMLFRFVFRERQKQQKTTADEGVKRSVFQEMNYQFSRFVRIPVTVTHTLYSRYLSVLDRHRFKLIGTGVIFCLVVGLATWIYTAIIIDLPQPDALQSVRQPSSTRIMDRNGKLLYKVYRNENRTLVQMRDLPVYVWLASVAIEDDTFFTHHGFSLRGMLRAARANFMDSQHKIAQGGSTITQQLVKNVYLSSERTYKRKVKEVVLAFMMELYYSKSDILQMYINEVAYGGDTYGIEEASERYFGKNARNLSLAEAALLAGLPSEPSHNSPFVDPEMARNRQSLVLKRMVDNHFITQQQADSALSEKLVFVPPTIHIKAPHFTMLVKDALIKKYGRELVEEGGLQVYTTLDLTTQRMAEDVVHQQLAAMGKAYRINNGAAMVTNPQTGEVLAMVGSADYFDPTIKGNVNVTTSLRQPGSSIKPINYAYAFENGGYTPGSVIDDSPITFPIPGQAPYTPHNYDGTFKGPMTLRLALAQSRNIPPVKLLQKYGVDKMLQEARKMGITTWNNPERYGLSLTLGGAEVSMLDMTTAYGTIATMGVRHDPMILLKVVDAQGKILVDNTKGSENNDHFFAGVIRPAVASDGVPEEYVWQSGTRVLSKSTAYWLINILSDNVARMPAFGSNAKLEIKNRTVAVKTGTTNDYKDNWTIGFTPDYVVASWVGNTDNQPMNSSLVSGITGAAPIWHDIMENLIKDKPDRVWAQPEEMLAVKICAINGMLACQNCPVVTTEYYPRGKEPKQACFFEPADVCIQKKTQADAEHKSPEEQKEILKSCYFAPVTPTPGH